MIYCEFSEVRYMEKVVGLDEVEGFVAKRRRKERRIVRLSLCLG